MAMTNMRKIRRLQRVVEMYDKQIEDKLQRKAELLREKMEREEHLQATIAEHNNEIAILQQEMQPSVAISYDYVALHKLFQIKKTKITTEIKQIADKIAKVLEEIIAIYMQKQKLSHTIKQRLKLKAYHEDKQQVETIDESSNLALFLRSSGQLQS